MQLNGPYVVGAGTNGSNTALNNYTQYQGDTLPLTFRVIASGLVLTPLPVVTITCADSVDIATGNIIIPETAFTVDFNNTVNVLTGNLILDSPATEALNLNQPITVRTVNNRPVIHPGLRVFWEIQFIQDLPRITRTWQGNYTIIGDINKANT